MSPDPTTDPGPEALEEVNQAAEEVAESAPAGPWHKRRWRDLSPTQQILLGALGAIEVILAAVAWTDLARRPRSLVRGGSKWRWASIIPINIVGPLVYLRWGRIRPDDSD